MDKEILKAIFIRLSLTLWVTVLARFGDGGVEELLRSLHYRQVISMIDHMIYRDEVSPANFKVRNPYKGRAPHPIHLRFLLIFSINLLFLQNPHKDGR